jgi:hypothetical protein
MNDVPKATAPASKFDPIRFSLETPMASSEELAVAFGQLIDGICDLSGLSVERTITAGLSSVTISWHGETIPSDEWLAGVEDQLMGFAACAGVHVRFRRR